MSGELPRPPSPGTVVLNYGPPAPGGRRWVLAAVIVALGLLGVWVSWPSPRRHDHSPELRCRSNLRQIGQGVQLYANENGGAFPPDVETLLLTQDLTSDVFVCAASNDTPATGATTRAVAVDLTAGGHLSYVYTGQGLNVRSPPNAIVAYERPANHSGVMNVLYADGHVERVQAPRAQELLSELDAGHNPPRAVPAR